ncbi:MAG: ATP-binding protein [Elainellaceae cyanobacterium]
MEPTRSLERILLVDDNPDDRLLAIREIKQEFPDVEIQEAVDWEQVYQAFRVDAFDMMITDYELNWATGIEILHALKDHDPNRPVIMFTDSGSQEIAVEAMKAGLDDYVLKAPKHRIRLGQAIRSVWDNALIRRRAEELEFRLQFLLNELGVGVFRATLDGKLIEASDGLLSLLGFSSPAEAQPFFEQELAWETSERSEQKRWHREIKLEDTSRNKPLWLQVSETVVPLDGQAVVDGLDSDVTQQKETAARLESLNQSLEARVNERTERLKQLNQELEAFAFSVSHELRAPIRQVSGFAELLRSELQPIALDEDVQHYIHQISTLTRRSGNMIDDLLQFSRTGRAEMQYTAVNMDKLVQEVQRQLSSEMKGRTIHWQIKALPPVEGDRNLLRQVWQNLIENAVKYTSVREQADIAISGTLGAGEALYSVRDNGIGFDMEDANRHLFGVFERLSNAREHDGTGIGLANVQKIVSRHGGRCWAEGEIDSGATFYFSLPSSDRETNA